MSKTSSRVPSYRHHKPSGQAVTTIDGRDIYLGKHNSAASRAEYQRVIAEWAAHGGVPPPTTNELTIVELLSAFMRHAKVYCRHPDQPEELTALRRLLVRDRTVVQTRISRSVVLGIGSLANAFTRY